MNQTDKSVALFEFVLAMTQSEKRYFARYASLHSGRADSEYFRLFQRIAGMRNYDAAVLRKEFGKHIEQLKQQLFGKLLTALRLFHENEDANQRAWTAYRNSQLLFRKNVTRHGQRELVHAKSIAATNQQAALGLYISEQEVATQIVSADAEVLIGMLEAFPKRSATLLSELQCNTIYTQQLLEVEILNRRFEGTRSEAELNLIKRFLNQVFLQDITCARTPKAELIFHFCNGLANYLQCDFSASAKHFESARSLLNEYSFLREQDPIMSVRVVADRALACFHDGDVSRFRESLDELKSADIGSSGLRDYVRDVALILELMSFNREKKYADAIRKFQGMRRKGFDSTAARQVNQQEIYFVFQEVTALWGMGELKKASGRLTHFLQDRTKYMKVDAHVTARIVFLLLWFEMEDETMTESELRSVRSLLLKKRKFYQVERTLIEFVSAMKTISTPRQRRMMTRDLSRKLAGLKKIPFERNAFLYFDFQVWAQKYEQSI